MTAHESLTDDLAYSFDRLGVDSVVRTVLNYLQGHTNEIQESVIWVLGCACLFFVCRTGMEEGLKRAGYDRPARERVESYMGYVILVVAGVAVAEEFGIHVFGAFEWVSGFVGG